MLNREPYLSMEVSSDGTTVSIRVERRTATGGARQDTRHDSEELHASRFDLAARMRVAIDEFEKNEKQ